MNISESLEPAKVFEYFEKICSIPHGSNNEKALSDYCVGFAKEHGLKYYQDKLYNVIIIKEAAKGCEDRPAVIIQGHLDMVCEKENDCTIDFEKDGLTLLAADGYLHADGTTLGGDDGIAIAYALALLDSDEIEHPKLEAVFTVCEELGMEGALSIDLSMLEGRILLNIDSEEEGVILAGCAGGCHITCRLPINFADSRDFWQVQNFHQSQEIQSYQDSFLRIELSGLTGGHSGCEIHKCRANANIIAGRFLLFLSDSGIDFEICGIEGGRKDNAIPVEASIIIRTGNADEVLSAMNIFAPTVCQEYKTSDPDMKITAAVLKDSDDDVDKSSFKALDRMSAKTFTALVNSLPNGIIAMSSDMPGMVETSLNLGIINMTDNCIELNYLLRSSKDSALDYLISRIKCIGGALSADVEVSSRYPAWEYNQDSRLRETMKSVYKKLYGNDLKVESIHAGVECGILTSKIHGLDCVSFGPDILDIHTPRERISIASVQRTWEYLLEVLKSL